MQNDERNNKPKDENSDENNNENNNIKKWIIALIALMLLLIAGVYTYYNYLAPQSKPGTAGEYIVEDEDGEVRYIIEDEDGETATDENDKTQPGDNGGGQYIIEDEQGKVKYKIQEKDGKMIIEDEEGEARVRTEKENGKVRYIIEDEEGEVDYTIEKDEDGDIVIEDDQGKVHYRTDGENGQVYENEKSRVRYIEPEKIADGVRQEIRILLVGLDDKESVEKGETEADSIYLAELDAGAKNITLTAFKPLEEVNNEQLKIYNTKQLQKIVEEVLEEKIDYYFSMSYEGFERIVDELGGVEIRLESSIEVSDLGLYLKEGNNLLSGKEALNYARFYDYEENGSERIQRQQKVIDSIYRKVTQTNMLLNVPAIFRSIVETIKSVDTNMDTQLIVEIINFIRQRDDFEIEYEIYSLE